MKVVIILTLGFSFTYLGFWWFYSPVIPWSVTTLSAYLFISLLVTDVIDLLHRAWRDRG